MRSDAKNFQHGPRREHVRRPVLSQGQHMAFVTGCEVLSLPRFCHREEKIVIRVGRSVHGG